MGYGLLLAMQAAGMIVDWLGVKKQQELGRMGTKIEQAGIESNIVMNRLAAQDESVRELQQLRENMGTQAAMMAARGTRSNAGSAVGILNKPISTFNADERMRRLNLLGSQASLKAGSFLSSLHQKTSEANQWNSFRSRIFSKIPTSPEAFSQLGKSFGLTSLAGPGG